MDFRTKITLEPLEKDWEIGFDDAILLLGSCFADSIGKRMQNGALQVLVNPFGTLYNPLSIAKTLNRLAEGSLFLESELFQSNGLWHSFMHHSSFSATTKEKALKEINDSFQKAKNQLSKAKFLILTFGSAWVYELVSIGDVVANCHKLPEKMFARRLLSVDEIVKTLNTLIITLRELNPNLHLLFTISPIRHLRDRAHGNQLSKSTLLLAVEQLCRQNAQTQYFPAYEIMLDELRDYRFYADDMLHPSSVAVQYIWERFCEQFFDKKTIAILQKIERLNKSFAHRPLNTETVEYNDFVKQRQEQLLALEREYGIKLMG